MNTLISEIKKRGEMLFGKREGLMSLWQTQALAFYVERANFTSDHSLGDDFASHLMTSYPVIARRDLGNAFGSMLRPSQKPWFKVRTARPDQEDTGARQWLDWFSDLQRNAMYDRNSGFVRATKEGDHDFATFGQCVIQVEFYRPVDGSLGHMLYRCWHLRDVAWAENAIGQISVVFRRWKPQAIDLKALFPKTLHAKVVEKIEKDPFAEVNVWHAILPRELYETLPGAKKLNTPFVSIYADIDNDHELECVGSWVQPYVIPRWQTVSGSQYAHSPATVAALPDARLLQAVTRVLLEAGEKAVNPPMIATADVVRSDISIFAGGVTWVDPEYDERLGEALRPISQDKSGLNYGEKVMLDLRGQLADAFYLSKLNLPPQGGPDMTAYEVGQRVQEFIRNALPLFEPMETDYNGQICEVTAELLFRNDPGLVKDIPQSIRKQEMRFQFESPLKEAHERTKVSSLVEISQIIAQAAPLDPAVAYMFDLKKAAREAGQAVAPAKWLRTEEEVQAMQEAAERAQEAAQLLATLEQGAGIAKTTSEAAVNATQAMPALAA